MEDVRIPSNEDMCSEGLLVVTFLSAYMVSLLAPVVCYPTPSYLSDHCSIRNTFPLR